MKPISVPRPLAAAMCVVALSTATLGAASRQDTPPSTGTACVGIVLPSVAGAEGSATDVATAVRDLFISYLTGPTINAIPLEARLPSQAVLEARQKGCGHVVIPSVVRKRKGGNKFGSILGQAAGSAAWHMPYGGGAGAAARAGAATAAAHAASTFASETRAKDEIELGYRVGTPDTVVQAKPISEKAKARSDGEDLLTPLVEQAAQKIASVAVPQ
jgi:hypothetical protein